MTTPVPLVKIAQISFGGIDIPAPPGRQCFKPLSNLLQTCLGVIGNRTFALWISIAAAAFDSEDERINLPVKIVFVNPSILTRTRSMRSDGTDVID
jgi:hypothetical protein